MNFTKTARQKTFISECGKYRIKEKRKFTHESARFAGFPPVEFVLDVQDAQDGSWNEVARTPTMRDCKLVATEMERKAA
ncbi:MAG TPA: hypothetical protein DEP37_01395 [Algoriphagus sp.]|nr:hypothetical protein [Algoriphagus sp.]|tara:strand:+ start:151 stop:387 length:237 start_codon:yes stop_codon:yes gene_type:complete